MKNRLSILLLVVFFSVVSIHAVLSLRKISTSFTPDFSVYYSSAGNILHHKNPYTDTHIFTLLGYPIMSVLFYIPFLIFPYQIAQGFFMIINFLSLIVIILLSLQLTKTLSISNFLLFFSLGFLSFPVKFTLGMGQVNLVACAVMLGGLLFYLKQNKKAAMILLSIAILLKPILLFMLLFFILKKSWRIVIGVCSTLFIITLATYLIYPTAMNYYISTIIPKYVSPAGREVYYNQGVMGFIARITQNNLYRRIIFGLIDIGIILLTSFSVVKTKNLLLGFSLVLSALVIIDSLSWQHHFIFLLFPWICAFGIIKNNKKDKIWFVPLMISYLLVSWNISNPSFYQQQYLILVLSHTLYGGILLLLMLISLV